MTFSRIWIALAALSSLAACGGDVRDLYTGTYAYNETKTFTGSTGQVTNSVSGSLVVTLNPDRNRIDLDDGQCTFTAFVNSSVDFTIDPTTCPSETVSNAATGETCTSTFSGSGSGSRSGNDIAYSLTGSADIVCPSASETQTEDRSLSGTLQ